MADSGKKTTEEPSDDKTSPKKSTASGAKASDDTAKSAAKKPQAKPSSRRVTPPKAKADQASRYTARGTNSQHRGPSPQWVPVLMFSLWGLGLLVIILNYMTLLPGASTTASGWYLIAGLLALLAGIVVATQYR